MTQSGSTPTSSGYVDEAGTRLYYETHGSGSPVLLVHGAFGSGRQFYDGLDWLTDDHEVILIDLQGHGRTADRPEPLSYERLADDCAAVLAHLGVSSCTVVGFSMGGGTAQQLAFRHPPLVSKLVVVSAPFSSSGWHADVMNNFRSTGAHQAQDVMGSFIFEDHASLAPKPEEFPALLDKLGRLLGHSNYDWSARVAALEIPVMVALGDADSLSPAHGAEFFGLLGGGKRDAGMDGGGMVASRLAVLPGTTHYDIVRSPMLWRGVAAFTRD